MKKLLLLASALCCGAVLTHCGNGGGASSVDVKTNEYLGDLPKIYAKHAAKIDEAKAEIDAVGKEMKASNKIDFNKLQEMNKEYEANKKTWKEELKAEVEPESQKVLGREVPFSYSDSLKNADGELFYEVQNAKITRDSHGKFHLTFEFKAAKAFAVPRFKKTNFKAYFRFVDKDKKMLPNSCGVMFPVGAEKEYAAGEAIGTADYPLNLESMPNRADFAGVEFISDAQHSNVKY